MVITCSNCQKQYKIDPEKITEKGAKITCPSCGHQFIVRRKGEQKEDTPKVKTPPCVICGNPSTRVLQGNPPMLLCEHCFDVENEKRRRFTAFEEQEQSEPGKTQVVSPQGAVPPSPEATVAFQEPKQEPPAQEERQEEDITNPSQGEKPGQEETSISGDTVQVQPPDNEEPMEKEKEAEFESFDEMPDFEGFETPSLEDKPRVEFTKPSAEDIKPEESPEAEPSFVSPPSDMLENPFQPAEDSSGKEDEEDFSYDAAEKSIPEFTRPPAEDKTETPEPDVFQPDVEPEPVFKKPPTPRPATPSLDLEVEQKLLHEKDEAAGLPGKAAAARAAGMGRSRVPAYIITAFVALIAVLGLVYYIYTQDIFSGFGGKIPGVEKPAPEVSKPEAPAEKDTSETDAIRKEAEAKKLADQITAARGFFLLDTPNGYQNAISEMESALKLVPDMPDAKAFMIEAWAFYASLKKNAYFTKRAERMLEKSPPEVVLRPEYDRARAHILINQGQGKPARDIITGILRKDPSDALAFYLLGETYMLDTPPSTDLAEENFRKSIELSPEFTRAYYALAMLLESQDKKDEAVAMYREVLKNSPNKSEAEEAIILLESMPEKKSAQTPQKTAPTGTAPKPASKTPGEQAAPEKDTAGLTPIEGIEKIGVEPEAAQGAQQTAGIETTEDLISDNIKEILTTIEQPMSRVPRRAAPPAPMPKPVSPSPQPETPYLDRPPEEAP